MTEFCPVTGRPHDARVLEICETRPVDRAGTTRLLAVCPDCGLDVDTKRTGSVL